MRGLPDSERGAMRSEAERPNPLLRSRLPERREEERLVFPPPPLPSGPPNPDGPGRSWLSACWP